jgi:hypothetical protein
MPAVPARVPEATVTPEPSARRDLYWLAAFAGVRAFFPLAALISGGLLPGFPDYAYAGPRGDAHGYISAARALISAAAGLGPVLVLLAAVALVAALAARSAWRRVPEARHWIVAALAVVLFSLLAAIVLNLEGQAPTGAIGWPFILGAFLLPFRVVGWIDDEVAVGVGIALAIVANAVTIFATAYIGERLSGSRRVGLAAAGTFALWPLLTWALLGDGTWQNSAWEIEAGLELYTEPVSTAFVAAGIALVLVRGRPPWASVAAGILLGYSASIRPTNIVFAIGVGLLFAAGRDWRSVGRLAAGGLTTLPLVLAFLPKKRGYDLELARDETGLPLWSSDYLVSSFTDATVWRPLLLVVLLPLAVVGVAAARRRAAAFALLGGVLANAAIYAFFRATWEHPRYLHAGLPVVLALWATGVAWLASRARGDAEARKVKTS